MSREYETTSAAYGVNESVDSSHGSRASSQAQQPVYETAAAPKPEITANQPRNYNGYETVDALDFHRLNISASPSPPQSISEDNAASSRRTGSEKSNGGSFWKRASQAELEDLRLSFREAENTANITRNMTLLTQPFSPTEVASGGFTKVRSETEASRERPRQSRTLSDEGPRRSGGNLFEFVELGRSNTTSTLPTTSSTLLPPAALANYSTIQQLEREFLDVQKQEALKLLDAHDWKKAQELISELLAHPLIEPQERDLWSFRRAHVLLILGYWSELWKTVSGLTDESGRVDHCLAEAYYCGGHIDKAESHCVTAMEKCGRLRAATMEFNKGPEEARWNELMALMADIMDDRGKKARSQFFRSKLPEGFVSSMEKSRGGDVRAVLRQANELLVPLNLRCMWGREKFTISGDTDFTLNHFRDALKEKNEILAWALFRDTSIATMRNRNDHGYTALHYAVQYSNLKYIQKLLSVGADIHAKSTDSLWTPLHFAATLDYTVSAEALLMHNVNIHMSDVWGSMPMHVAAARDNVTIIKLLHEADSTSIDRKNTRFGYTPLEVAIMYDNPKAADCLLELGATGEEDSPFTPDFTMTYEHPTSDMLREMKALYVHQTALDLMFESWAKGS